MLKRKFGFKKSLGFFLGIFVLTTISLVFYYITPILFAWNGPSEGPPGGNIDLVGIVRNRFNMVEENVSGNVGIDLSQGSVFKHTLTGNVTYTDITGFSAGKLNTFKLVVEQDTISLYTITWPGNITWKNYENPLDLALSTTGVYDFVTLDDGTTWYGSVYYDSRGGIQIDSGGSSKPTCNLSNRGVMWVSRMPGGSNDEVEFCLRAGDHSYKWYPTMSAVNLVCGEVFTDPRDGQAYSTVQIGTQCWMAKNLAYLPSVVPAATGSNSVPYYYVYGYNGTDVNAAKATANYTNRGVLYNWPAAMDGDTVAGSQGICPDGWHLPSDAEQHTLDSYLSSPNPCNASTSGIWGNCDEAGQKMKTSTWGGNNISGFTALPSGLRGTGGTFLNISNTVCFWSSSSSGSTSAWFRNLNSSYISVYRAAFDQGHGHSVRCLKN